MIFISVNKEEPNNNISIICLNGDLCNRKCPNFMMMRKNDTFDGTSGNIIRTI